jgi:Ras-related protein Rab-32
MEKQQYLFKVLVIGDYAGSRALSLCFDVFEQSILLVGKTSLIKRYVDGIFTPNYKLTIGVDFAVKVPFPDKKCVFLCHFHSEVCQELDWNDEKKVTLQLWDIAGHERFGLRISGFFLHFTPFVASGYRAHHVLTTGTMTRVYYKYAVAALIVFDLSRPTTFDAVLKWHQDLNQKVSAFHTRGY